MYQGRDYRIGRWADYISRSHNRKPPAGKGIAARQIDRLWKRLLLFLIIFFFWLGLGISPVWSIVATFFTAGLLSRYSVTQRSVKVLMKGKEAWQVVRGQPEAAVFNHRFAALTGVGGMLLSLAGVLAGPWAWYYGVLGALNLFLSILVLWLRGRVFLEPEKN